MIDDTTVDTDVNSNRQLIPGAPAAFSGRLAFLERLVRDIPTNEFGLPIGIYRLDLVPQDPTPDELRNAFVPLSYVEGFPAFADGRPLWSHLPFEPQEAYKAFDAYLQLPMTTGTGARTLYDLMNNVGSLGFIPGTIQPEALHHFFFGYCWEHRVKAYDLWNIATRQKAQELRAIETLDKHYFTSKRLMKRLMLYFEGPDAEEDFWDLMTPKVAIDFFNKLIAAQRISAGLSATGGGTGRGRGGAGALGGDGDDVRPGTSLEVIFRGLAQQNAIAHEGMTIDASTEALQIALDDPATAEMAQELIIRLGSVN